MNGGTMLIDSPTPYSRQADGLLKKLGINPVQLAARCDNAQLYSSLGLQPSVFFDKETFGADRLVVGEPGGDWRGGAKGQGTWKEFLARTPLSPPVQRDIERIQGAEIDYLPGLTSAEKKDRLSRISYKDFLLKLVKADPGVIPFYQTRTNGEWGVGIDAEPALDCWALGLPGFQGMKLEPGAAPRMSYTAAGYANGGSYRFHFPDGNASIARLLVRDLIPAAVPGRSAEDVVTAKVDYSRLDQSGSPVRLRLNSTVVGVRNQGDPAAAREVEVT
jgi:spermidine dehydrogenase